MPAITVHASSQSPSTSFMPYRPGGRPISQAAARRAPRAKVIRSVARWVNSSRSPAPVNVTVCSPTMSPARTTEKPMLPASAWAHPCRGAQKRRLRRKVTARDLAMVSPKLQGRAGRCVALLRDDAPPRCPRRSAAQAPGRRSGQFIQHRDTRRWCWARSARQSTSPHAQVLPVAGASNPVAPTSRGTEALRARLRMQQRRRCPH